MRAECQDRDAERHQLEDPVLDIRLAQFEDGDVEWSFAHRLRACASHDLLQLAAKEEVAALDEDALHPASFCVRCSTSWLDATRSCLSVSRSRTVTV